MMKHASATKFDDVQSGSDVESLRSSKEESIEKLKAK
jgi:hypothetical protein